MFLVLGVLSEFSILGILELDSRSREMLTPTNNLTAV